ncbi:MAG: LLM class flavin-dependent oxidoreductase [Chloroflexi bacterium]|nr:LLM class flavin-dependent oxidoreductase [Chloroflexota bacterium]
MKFGIFITPQHPMSDSPVQRFREVLEQVRLAREAGFDTLASGHHYLSAPYQSLQNIPLLARLASESGDMRLCISILLLALLNPVQVAEEVATLDILSEGRVIFGVGLGYRQVEYQAFNVRVKDGPARLVESLELIKRLWTEEQVTHEGSFFNLKEATCTVRPVQRPHPPIWMAADADAAVARAGRLGYPWLANPHAALPTIARQMDLYKRALAEAGHGLPEERPLMLEMYVAPTREEALQIARPFLASKYRAYADWGQDRVLPGKESFRVPFEELARDRFLLGSPQDVVQQVQQRIRALDCNHFIFRIGWPGMEHRHILQAIDLVGEKVIPQFRKRADGSEEG